MTIGVSDESGAILALYRMPDGTVFSADVAMTKARNAYYFSTREGYEVLRDVARNGDDRYDWLPEPPAGQGWAVTAHIPASSAPDAVAFAFASRAPAMSPVCSSAHASVDHAA